MDSERIAIERLVRSFVALGSDLDVGLVIPGNDPGPAPSAPYASVLLMSSDGAQYPPITQDLLPVTDDEGNVSTTVKTMCPRQDTYSVQWYRTGSRGRAHRFAMWAISPEGVLASIKRKFTITSCTDVRRIDEWIAGEAEERAGVDLVVDYLVMLRQTQGVVETVPRTVDAGSQGG